MDKYFKVIDQDEVIAVYTESEDGSQEVIEHNYHEFTLPIIKELYDEIIEIYPSRETILLVLIELLNAKLDWLADDSRDADEEQESWYF